MSAYNVIVQDPIYGFELDGKQWRLQEHLSNDDGSRAVRISTDARNKEIEDPYRIFFYVPKFGWDCDSDQAEYEIWWQISDPDTLRSLTRFLNKNNPPVMKIHRA